MSDMEVYEIDDDFDPLEDLEPEAVEEDEQEHDYLPPIPDAELSRVPEVVPLTVEEKIDKLITGMPGQKHRLMRALKLCETPQRMDQVAEILDVEFATQARVFDTTQIVRLLEQAGALSSSRAVDEEGADKSATSETKSTTEVSDREVNAADGIEQTASGDATPDFITPTPPPPTEYLITNEGREAYERYAGTAPLLSLLSEEKRYLPIYRTILEMTSEGTGRTMKELDAAVNGDPLLQDPKRFCGYFLDRLEEAGAVHWNKGWTATSEGTNALTLDLFTSEDGR